MTIQYIEPFRRGFGRMRKALFNPFDLKKWFVVGFTAFLSGLTDCRGGNGSGTSRRGNVDWEEVIYFPQRAWEWLADNPVWAMVIAFAAFVVFVLIILCTWWSSRGKFMFLDNVVHDRAQVIAPWNEYRVEGNSLFLWSLAIWAIVMAVAIWYVVRCFIAVQALYEASDDVRLLLGPVILMALGFFAIFIVVGFLDIILYDFVVQIMYKGRMKTGAALRKFLTLFWSKLIYFLGYALFTLLVVLVVVIGIVVFGLLTCCIGFVLLAIPYINSVVLLPVSYTMRAFSVEFLEQFGPEYHIFPRPESAAPTSEARIA
jgi:hypothetical protein